MKTINIHDREYDLGNPLDVIRFVARERYAWPGGYMLSLVFPSGAVLCQDCLRKSYRDTMRDAMSDLECGVSGDYGIMNSSELDPLDVICDDCGNCCTGVSYREARCQAEELETDHEE